MPLSGMTGAMGQYKVAGSADVLCKPSDRRIG